MARAQKYQDPGGRHVRIYATLLNCMAFRALGFSSKALFIDLREKVNGTNNGNIEATIATMKHKGWKAKGTLISALRELQALGFIDITRRGGGVETGRRLCHLYRFTDLAVIAHPKLFIEAQPATNDFLRFQSLAEAEKALKEWVDEAKSDAVERHNKACEKASERNALQRNATSEDDEK